MTTTTKLKAILNALPQTQCGRCGFSDCEEYAKALLMGAAKINRCPVGGHHTISLLAQLLNQNVIALDTTYGEESPRYVALINEDACTGCTRCIKTCPVDAIIGASKKSHTVFEKWCVGCHKCIDICPMDCITTKNVSGDKTSWEAWSQDDARRAQARYLAHKKRLATLTFKSDDDKKRAIIKKVIAKAKERARQYNILDK